jgi:hypothetical protein
MNDSLYMLSARVKVVSLGTQSSKSHHVTVVTSRDFRNSAFVSLFTTRIN